MVNCANTGATAIPSRLPMDSTSVALDGNAITSLKSHTFIGRKNLRVLYLNSSLVQVIIFDLVLATFNLLAGNTYLQSEYININV